MIITNDIFIDKAKSIHGDKYDYSKVVYVNMKTKVEIICPIHGVFKQTPDKHIHGKCGCPVCAGNQPSNNFEFINKAKKVHGDTYDYSLVDYKNNKTPVDIVCKVHGVFQQKPANHLNGKGCAYCANNVLLTTDLFIQKAIDVHGDKYGYDHVVYCGNRTPVSITCPIHGDFEQVPYVHLNGSGCPLCGRKNQSIHRDSKLIYEKAVATFLQKYGVSNPMYDSNIRMKHKSAVSSDIVNAKRIQTKRENNSFNVSLPEYKLGIMLKSVFGEFDVLHNYISDVYPFQCDFYICSRKLYIELNAHWSHGGHWYDSNSDEFVISDWLLKSNFYKNAAYTFSVRDVEKRRVACQNHLNYVVFWDSDLSDAKRWFEMGCPDGQDWMSEYSWL